MCPEKISSPKADSIECDKKGECIRHWTFTPVLMQTNAAVVSFSRYS
jgi:hypothetical protein